MRIMIPKVAALFDTSHAAGRGILRGITKYARLNGPWVFYRQSPNYISEKKDRLKFLKNWGLHGIIANLDESSEVSELISDGFPAVLFPVFKEQFKFQHTMCSDNQTMGQIAGDYFLKCGFNNMGFCGYGRLHYWSHDRGQSFMEYLKKQKIEIFYYEQAQEFQHWNKEQEVLARWLDSLPKPIAILACNDDRGYDLIEACKIASLQVPDDVSILGIDNDELVCNMCRTPLSSIAINTERGGYEAAELLGKLMAGEKPEPQVIVIRPTHVVARESTDLLSIEDRDVAMAIRFIKDHFKEPIRVNDVVNAVPLSRRVLEHRFRKTVSRSINSEIRRIRVEHIASLLVETNKPISELGLSMSFSSIDHISRYFKAEKGVSLQEFRNRYGNK